MLTALLLSAVAAVAPAPAPAPAPADRVIFDTDLHADVDDTAALAMLHELHDRREIRLLGVMVSTAGRYGAPCADAINTYYGRPNLPVGALKPVDDSLAWKDYCKALVEEYPNDLQDGGNAVGATRLYRRLLRDSPDHSVTVISVGFLTNLRNLLRSRAGRRLVRDKVNRLVVMGGTYPAGTEYNFENDSRAAAAVARRWSRPIVFSGFELGLRILTGPPPSGPVHRAYELGLAEGHKRSSWDQTAVLSAVRGRLFERVSGLNRVDGDNGANAFHVGAGSHSYLRRSSSRTRIARAIRQLVR